MSNGAVVEYVWFTKRILVHLHVGLSGFRNNLAKHGARSPLNHRDGYASPGDRPSGFAGFSKDSGCW